MIIRSAVISEDKLYRYALWRSLACDTTKPFVAFIGLNPSVADGEIDDPTIRRCWAFTQAWGYSRLCMLNLFAFRATDPADMLAADWPIGPQNDAWLQRLVPQSAIAVAAWGTQGGYLNRNEWARRTLPRLHYLRLTKHGHPQHPLYLPASCTPQLWTT